MPVLPGYKNRPRSHLDQSASRVPLHSSGPCLPPATMARNMVSLLYSLFALFTVALAAGARPNSDYDVIVIGGGPSGLSAISGLSRVLRKTVMFDSGKYRNAPTRNMHDVIGNDGISLSAISSVCSNAELT